MHPIIDASSYIDFDGGEVEVGSFSECRAVGIASIAA